MTYPRANKPGAQARLKTLIKAMRGSFRSLCLFAAEMQCTVPHAAAGGGGGARMQDQQLMMMQGKALAAQGIQFHHQQLLA